MRLGVGVILDVGNPLRQAARSLPQPDLAVIRGRRYAGAIPGTADALLVIEIADSSLGYDRNAKFPRYAAAGIPEAWLFDLTARRMACHSAPRAARYRQVKVAGDGQELFSTALPAVAIVAEAAFW